MPSETFKFSVGTLRVLYGLWAPYRARGRSMGPLGGPQRSWVTHSALECSIGPQRVL